MQKFALYVRTVYWRHPFITKTLLVMKLTIFLLTAAFLNVSANGVSQTVTFSGQNAKLNEVFASVKKQTGFSFIYFDVYSPSLNLLLLRQRMFH